MKRRIVERASKAGSLFDSLNAFPNEPTESLSRSRDRRRKRPKIGRLVHVTSTLGLIKVRMSGHKINELNQERLLLCSLLSQLVYHSPESIRLESAFQELTASVSPGFPITIQTNNVTDPQASIWKFAGHKVLYIAFRGNYDKPHLFERLEISPVFYCERETPFQEGLVDDFKYIEASLQPILGECKAGIDSVAFAGHGLGGSLAAISAPYFAELFPGLSIHCYTFGAPKVGNDKFGNWFKTRISESVRVIMSSDPLPHLPLRNKTIRHPDDGVCITKSGYVEKWASSQQPSFQVLSGITKIDFEGWRWQQNSTKYHRRIVTAIARGRRGHTCKEYGPHKVEREHMPPIRSRGA